MATYQDSCAQHMRSGHQLQVSPPSPVLGHVPKVILEGWARDVDTVGRRHQAIPHGHELVGVSAKVSNYRLTQLLVRGGASRVARNSQEEAVALAMVGSTIAFGAQEPIRGRVLPCVPIRRYGAAA